MSGVNNSSIINQLADAFQCLPGVGPKTAQRMVLHLLERDRDGGRHLAERMSEAMDKVGNCESCRNLTEKKICEICSNQARDKNSLCIVETPADVLAIEQSGAYRGLYFVLMANLSPIEGIGPAEIGIELLLERCAQGVKEVILAVGSTIEGEATAHYISEVTRPTGVVLSRIAQGIPLGGELGYVDGGTLSHALEDRKTI
ncbi:MAG: recombination protein RecR [Gammaproteobacteria bacterium]|jgi:recombination protein RecR|nr:recombination protein RecR [Gammaproteobacteria bacterium]|tara:strand:+ start:2185 stop:2787 length:603 start_codon:yes stop_codon:yes gene_type:complete